MLKELFNKRQRGKAAPERADSAVRSEFGVVLVATQKASYVSEAYHSAVSIKHHAPDLSVTLFTDQRDKLSDEQAAFFDQIEVIESTTQFKSSWACGQFDRLQCLSKTPYELTLHIDADTICLSSDIAQLYTQLAVVDMALTVADPERSFSAKHYGAPMFYTGLMLYRRNDAVFKLFTEWKKFTEQLYNAATSEQLDTLTWLAHIKDPQIKARLGTMDQISFVQLLAPDKSYAKLSVGQLNEGWNYTGRYTPEVQDQVKIYAARLPQKYLHQLNELVGKQDYAAFRELADRLLCLFPWRLDIAFLLARYHAQVEGDAEATMRALAGRLRWDPTNKAAQQLLHASCLHPRNRMIMREPYLSQMYEFLCTYLPDQNESADSSLLSRVGLMANRLGYAEQAVELTRSVHQPKDEQSSVNLAIALIGNEQSEQAIDILQDCPRSSRSLAILQVAYHEAEKEQDYYRIFDVDKAIFQTRLDLDWNDDLASYVKIHPSNRWQPAKHYTKNAWHSGALQDDDNGLVKRLKIQLVEQLKLYLGTLHQNGYGKLMPPMPAQFRLKMWATVMQGQEAEQEPHAHPSGWCSGVYYCSVSEVLSPQDHGGTLYFGPPPQDRVRYRKPFAKQRMTVSTGTLVMFPSYFWHGTEPFDASDREQPRICIAFDFEPVKPLTKTSSSETELDKWSIGIYQQRDGFDWQPHAEVQNPVLTRHDVTDCPAAFVADPFVCRQADQWHMFFEIYNQQHLRGEIGYASSKDGLSWQYQQVVIRENWHLSYPYLVQDQGQHFMVLSDERAGLVHLYQAQPFPSQWHRCVTLLSQPLADVSVIKHEGRWWLWGTDIGANMSNENLRLFTSQQLEAGWIEHPASPIVSGNRQLARSAGRVHMHGENMYRLAQDCRQHYGAALELVQITELTQTSYKEAHVKTLLAGSGSGWNAEGMHHADIEPVSGLIFADGKAYIGKLKAGGQAVTKVSQVPVDKLNYRKNVWSLSVERCPCDVHFCEYMDTVAMQGRSIFHFGTGDHHILATHQQFRKGLANSVLGITASLEEHRAFAQLIIDKPQIASYYQVLFGDIYTLNVRLLPLFDVVNLFHLGEYHDPEYRYQKLDDQGVLDLFFNQLYPGGEMLFYRQSVGFGRVKEIIESKAGLVFEREYKTLLVYKKAMEAR